ncbi:hypothetical protein EDB83DRAFT_842586 [Lactarius deliciosus]|nr:hypothetical protein EDB83DRAFT_842586 [Lactarius deliciosus]
MTSNPHPNSALAVGMSLFTEPQEVGAAIAANAGKRNERFDPYAPSKNKCKSKSSTTSTSTPASSTDSSNSPYPVVPTGFADPNMAMLQHAHYAATYGLVPAYSYPLGPSLPVPPGMYPGAMFPTGPPPSSASQAADPPFALTHSGFAASNAPLSRVLPWHGALTATRW